MNEALGPPSVITPNTAFFKMLVGILASLLFIAVLVFGGAGQLTWGLGWLFVVVWGALKLVFILILRWHDPDLLVERATRHENTERYDRWIVPVYFILAFGTILLAALDGGRFHWSDEMPAGLIITAYLIYLIGNGLASWAISANPFFFIRIAPAVRQKSKSNPHWAISICAPSGVPGRDCYVAGNRFFDGILVCGHHRFAGWSDDDPSNYI